MPSSSVQGDTKQQCWAWNYTRASLLRVASQSKPASHLPQFLTAQEQVLVVYARNKPRGRSDPAGTHRSWILQVRQTIEPSILQCHGCICFCSVLCRHSAFLCSCAGGKGRTQCCLPQLTFANSEVGSVNSLLHYVRCDSAHFPSQQLPLLPRQLFH